MGSQVDVALEALGVTVETSLGTDPDRVRTASSPEMLAALAPEELGGGGLGLRAFLGHHLEIAGSHPARAVGLVMHHFTLFSLASYWSAHRDLSGFLLEGIAREQAVLASAFAEPLASRTTANAPGCVARRSGARSWELSGAKVPVSLLFEATLICLSARDPERGQTLVLLVPAASPGLSRSSLPDDNPLGTLAGAGQLSLDRCEVDDRLVFWHSGDGQADDELFSLSWAAFTLLSVATYAGAALRMLLVQGDLLAARWQGSPLGAAAAGNVLARLASLLALADGLCARWDGAGFSTALYHQALQLRILHADTVERSLPLLAALLGGRSLLARPDVGQESSLTLLDLAGSLAHPPNVIDAAVQLASCAGLHQDPDQ